MLVGIRIYLHSLLWHLVLLLRQWLRNLNLILIILLVHLLDNIALSLAHSHNILLLLDQEIIQILLNSGINLCLFRLEHISESLIYSPQILYLKMLLLLDLFILEYLFPLLNDSFPHPHHFLHVLILELNNLLEGVLIHRDHLLILIIKGRRWLVSSEA
jgi:hypothetical protein